MSDLESVLAEANKVEISASAGRAPKLNNETEGLATIVEVKAYPTRNSGPVVELLMEVNESAVKVAEDAFKAPTRPNRPGELVQLPFFLKKGDVKADSANQRALKEAIFAIIGKTSKEVTTEQYATLFNAARGPKQLLRGTQVAFSVSHKRTQKGKDIYVPTLRTVAGQDDKGITSRRSELDKKYPLK